VHVLGAIKQVEFKATFYLTHLKKLS